MKNRYIVKFVCLSGRQFFIRHFDGINAITEDIEKAVQFTNKQTATDKAKYFLNYVLSEKAVFEVVKL